MNLIIDILGYFIVCVFIYNIVISLFSLKIKINKIDEVEQSTSFSILIPCYNEENVIWDTLLSLNNTEYNKGLLKIYVIADNCTDSTVDMVNKFKEAYTGLNCNLLEVKGGSKPKAINEAIKVLKNKNLWIDECIFVLDADNRVSKTLFKNFNKYNRHGFKILQCAIHSLNDDSFIAKGFTSAFNNMNRGFQYSRNKIGLSGSLCGTGFSIKREIWDEIDFTRCDTLTEDLEFSILGILDNIKIKFIYNDYVLNQHLDKFKPSFIQRLRWSRGHTQVFIKLSGKTTVNLIKHPSLQLFDSLIFMFNPFRNVTYIIVLALEIIFQHTSYISVYFMIIPMIYYVCFFMYCDNWKINYFIPHIFYAFTMYFATVYGAITFRNKKWVKTFHRKIEK